MTQGRFVRIETLSAEASMTRKTATFLLLLMSAPVLSGCIPLAVGAGGAIAADEAVENDGGNLF